MASSKEYSYLAIDPGEIPVEDDLLMVTTNWVFVTKLFPFDSNRNMVSLENRKLLIECINESTEEVLLTTIDMHDRNLVEQKEDHYEIKHMLLKTGVLKVYFILDSKIVCCFYSGLWLVRLPHAPPSGVFALVVSLAVSVRLAVRPGPLCGSHLHSESLPSRSPRQSLRSRSKRFSLSYMQRFRPWSASMISTKPS